MRDIKFRAWDIERNIIIGSSYRKNWENYKDEWYDDIAKMDLTGIESISKDDRYIVEQYTGLKDKNGKEIYEGDILEHPNGEMFTVIFDKSFCGFRAKYNNNLIDDIASSIIIQIGDKGLAIVIGNIHENPELTEAGK